MQFWSFRVIFSRLKAIRFMMADKTVPKSKKAIIIAGIVYLFLPFDLIPALVFPLIMVIHFLSNWDMTLFYFLTMLVMTIAFVVNIKVRKPGKLGLAIIIAIGLIEFVLCILAFGNYEG